MTVNKETPAPVPQAVDVKSLRREVANCIAAEIKDMDFCTPDGWASWGAMRTLGFLKSKGILRVAEPEPDEKTYGREKLAAVREALEKLRQKHLECEDSWYSCPKSEEGSANIDLSADECRCGADDANAIIEQALRALDAMLPKFPNVFIAGKEWTDGTQPDAAALAEIFRYDHPKSDERIRRIMERLGMSDSMSIYLGLKQFETEIIVGLREEARELLRANGGG
jgi:hypothetical protein